MRETARPRAHGVVASARIRLYLLRYRRGMLVIEVHDEARAPGGMRQLDMVAKRFRFAV